MKTFETEKNNIPEGATHYIEESAIMTFGWAKGLGTDKFSVYPVGLRLGKWIGTNENIHSIFLKPIPQTKDVEWVNGDECRYSHDVEHEYVYVGEHPHGDGHYVFSEEKGITYIANGYLLEPETEAERVERERLEWIEKWGSKIKHIGTMTYKDILGEMHDSLK
jgi:hypothetical protein